MIASMEAQLINRGLISIFAVGEVFSFRERAAPSVPRIDRNLSYA